jgi:site-specific DNA-methyltransferase (adenine-specific)
MAGTRFCNAHETMLWCSKSEKNKFCFNYKTMKALNNDKQEKSVWTLGICQGNERLRDEQGNKIHNTQKPEELLQKVILSSTKPNYIDENFIVLDPFFGSGTTGAVCKKYGRNFIGIEKDDNNVYIKAALERISNIQTIVDKYSNLSLEVKPPKVSIKQLIENKYLSLNEVFYDKNGKQICTLISSDKVKDDIDTLSIHKMAAKYQNKDNANGWDYFYVKRENTLVSINQFRYDFIQNN